MLAEVVDMASNGPGGAEKVIAREAMAEGLPTSGVLLISVGKGNISPLLHVMPRTATGWDALGKRATEGDIRKVKWLAASVISSRGQRVFPRSAEEVESEDGQVEEDCLGLVLVRVGGKTSRQGAENHNVDGPDLRGGQVCIGPRLEEGL